MYKRARRSQFRFLNALKTPNIGSIQHSANDRSCAHNGPRAYGCSWRQKGLSFVAITFYQKPKLQDLSMVLRVIISTLLTAIISGCGYCVLSSSECYFSSFEHVDEARERGAFEKGWLPQWLPESAIEIHEGHDLDTNAQAISFSLPTKADFNPPALCRSVSTAPHPNLKTSIFPRSVHRFTDIRLCDDLYLVIDGSHRVHLWKN